MRIATLFTAVLALGALSAPPAGASGDMTGAALATVTYTSPLDSTLGPRGFTLYGGFSGPAYSFYAQYPPLVGGGILSHMTCTINGSSASEFPFPFDENENYVGGNGRASLLCDGYGDPQAYSVNGSLSWARVGPVMVFRGTASMTVSSLNSGSGAVVGTALLVPKDLTNTVFYAPTVIEFLAL